MADPTPGYPAFSEFSDVFGELRDTYEAMRAEVERLREVNEQFGQRQDWWSEKMFALETEVERLRADKAALSDRVALLTHGATDVDINMLALVERAEKAEAEVERLRELCERAAEALYECRLRSELWVAASGTHKIAARGES